jgi:hypothetical protein
MGLALNMALRVFASWAVVALASGLFFGPGFIAVIALYSAPLLFIALAVAAACAESVARNPTGWAAVAAAIACIPFAFVGLGFGVIFALPIAAFAAILFVGSTKVWPPPRSSATDRR